MTAYRTPARVTPEPSREAADAPRGVLGELLGAAKWLIGEQPVQVRCRYIPRRQRQKRHFKAGRCRAGRHRRMPPALYGARIGYEWEPFDPGKLMTHVAGMVQEIRLP